MKQLMRIDKLEPNQGILNFSHLLEAPAGRHGFIQTKNGHLYFADGQRARFLGFNIAARSNTPDHVTAEKLAERFASMGVNVIRLHAADAPIGDEPCSKYRQMQRFTRIVMSWIGRTSLKRRFRSGSAATQT